MRRFKKGDVVKCVELGGNSYISPGETYTVESVQIRDGKTYLYLTVDNDSKWWYNSDLFTLESKPRETPKVKAEQPNKPSFYVCKVENPNQVAVLEGLSKLIQLHPGWGKWTKVANYFIFTRKEWEKNQWFYGFDSITNAIVTNSYKKGVDESLLKYSWQGGSTEEISFQQMVAVLSSFERPKKRVPAKPKPPEVWAQGVRVEWMEESSTYEHKITGWKLPWVSIADAEKLVKEARKYNAKAKAWKAKYE